MKKIVLVTFFFGTLLLSAPTNHACSCAVPEIDQSFKRANAVFIGEVTEIIAPKSYDEMAPLSDRLYTVKLKVEKSWKGVKSHEVSILSDQGTLQCISYKVF